MWAEWMKDFDLRLTKEEIEEYFRRKKEGQAMNLKDKIMRLFGYENIEKINILSGFIAHAPKCWKIKYRRWHYNRYKKFIVPIVLTKRRTLVDGYTSYLIAKENNIKYVKVVRV